MGISIVVDANEARCGLARLLAREWNSVWVCRLKSGDVAIGGRILIERKTIEDLAASLADGRLFRQAAQISTAARPVLVLEGDPRRLSNRIPRGSLRGVWLALTVGFRIPILTTPNLAGTAACIRHLAAQEARRATRRRRRSQKRARVRRAHRGSAKHAIDPQTIELLQSLPGVGKERARLIAEQLGPVSEVCRLGIRGLLSVRGIGPDTAARIADALGEGFARRRS